MEKVIAVCLSDNRGKAKKEVDEVRLKKNHGLEGDIHAGPGKRQVSLLDRRDIEVLRNKGIESQPGDFSENIIVDGIDFTNLKVGNRLKIEQALLEITEFGKKEWKPGDYSFKGIPLVAKKGIFARVLQDGYIRRGNEIEII